MAATHGKGGQVKLGAAPGTVTIAEVKKWSLNESIDVADATTMGDAAKRHLPGISEGDGSVECQWDVTDTTGQEALTIGASVTLNLFYQGSATGKKYKTFTATITKIGVDVAFDGIAMRSFDFKVNGAITQGTAP